MDPIPYLKEHLLLVDARTNHLNIEIPGFTYQPRYYSEDIGIPLFQCLVFLALINNNRDYCVKRSFRKDNLLLCPKLKQFRFKTVDRDDLDAKSEEFNRAEKSVVDIIKSCPLLIKIESKRPTGVSEEEDTKGTGSSTGANLSGLAVAKFYASRKLTPSEILGKMVIALPRHTIEHAFDKDTRQVLSTSSADAEPKRLWRYSLEQVVDLLMSILPMSILPAYVIKAQETFLKKNLWSHLKIDNF